MRPAFRIGLPALGFAFAFALLSWRVPVLAADAKPGSPILGFWRSIDTARGSVGALFEFREGGALEYTPASVTQTTYRVEGDALVLARSNVSPAEQRLTMEWLESGNLRLSAQGTPTVVLARRDPEPAPKKGSRHPLAGVWTGPREMAGQSVTATYVFQPDGTLFLLVPFQVSHGRYALDGSRIRLGVPDQWDADGTFQIDGDTLTITVPSDKGPIVSKYARY